MRFPVKLVPVDLRVMPVARPPDGFQFRMAVGIGRIARHITVVVGHTAPGIVPAEPAGAPYARLRCRPERQFGRGAQRSPVKNRNQRPHFTTYARIADFAVLITPQRIVKRIARKSGGLAGDRSPQPAHGEGHDGHERQLLLVREPPGQPNARLRRLGKDPFGMEVASGAGIQSQRELPLAREKPCYPSAHSRRIAPVRKTDGGTGCPVRLIRQEEEGFGLSVSPQAAGEGFLQPERAKHRGIVPGHGQRPYRRMPRIAPTATGVSGKGETIAHAVSEQIAARLHGTVKQGRIRRNTRIERLGNRFKRVVFRSMFLRGSGFQHENQQSEAKQ